MSDRFQFISLLSSSPTNLHHNNFLLRTSRRPISRTAALLFPCSRRRQVNPVLHEADAWLVLFRHKMAGTLALLLRFHCPFLRFLLNFGGSWMYNLYKNKPFIFGERLICCNIAEREIRSQSAAPY